MEASKLYQAFLVECHDCNKSQEKFVIPVYYEEEKDMFGFDAIQFYGFYINTHDQNFKKLKICNVPIRERNHYFLQYDSSVNVNKIHKYEGSLLSNKLGSVAPQCVQLILNRALECPVLERKHKNKIREQREHDSGN